MKLKLLKGIVYDLCDSISSSPFHSTELIKNELPLKDKWIFDLKHNNAINEKGKKITPTFQDKNHKWFLKQIKNANISMEDIDKAELIMEFDLRHKDKGNKVSFEIECSGKKYFYEKYFSIFTFIG